MIGSEMWGNGPRQNEGTRGFGGDRGDGPTLQCNITHDVNWLPVFVFGTRGRGRLDSGLLCIKGTILSKGIKDIKELQVLSTSTHQDSPNQDCILIQFQTSKPLYYLYKRPHNHQFDHLTTISLHKHSQTSIHSV